MYQWMMILQQHSKMDQLRRKYQAKGTYTVAPDGTVTFTPEKGFTGKGTGVTVKRVDKNGTPVTAKYTPTVTPVTPTAEPAETTDIQGKEQTGKPTFTPGNPDVPMMMKCQQHSKMDQLRRKYQGRNIHSISRRNSNLHTREELHR